MIENEELRVLDMLTKADAGEHRIEAVSGDFRLRWGNYTFKVHTDEGVWVVVVFNDCNSWDYIDTVTDPSGQSWGWPLDDYVPGDPLLTLLADYDIINFGAVADWVPKNASRWGLASDRMSEFIRTVGARSKE